MKRALILPILLLLAFASPANSVCLKKCGGCGGGDCTPVVGGSDGDIVVSDGGTTGTISGERSFSGRANVAATTGAFVGGEVFTFKENMSTSTWEMTELRCNMGTGSAFPIGFTVAVDVSDQTYATTRANELAVTAAATDGTEDNATFSDTTCASSCSIAPGEFIILGVAYVAGTIAPAEFTCAVSYTVTPD